MWGPLDDKCKREMIYGWFMLFPSCLMVCMGVLRGVLIFYAKTMVLLFCVSPAKQSLLCRATDGVPSGLNAWLISCSMLKNINTHTISTISGPRGLRSVPSDPGDLKLRPISPVRVDWSLGRWGSVCPPVLETQECTVVFIVWLPGLVKRVMISNDISSAHHTHHLFIWGRKVNRW